MKYTLSNIINKPLDEVMDKFKNEKDVMNWMEGLQKIERISGNPHEVGTKSDFHFLFKKKEMKISETILESNLPHQIKFAYQSPMGYNEVEMQFEEVGENEVRQINNSYFELKGLMKVFGFLLKGMFKKQSLKYMSDFKNYCENNN